MADFIEIATMLMKQPVKTPADAVALYKTLSAHLAFCIMNSLPEEAKVEASRLFSKDI
jgi:hypothetical protein